jgi:hypothetical protein
MAPARPLLQLHTVAYAIALFLGAVCVATPASAAYVMNGDLLGQTCRDAAVRTTCDPPFKIEEVRGPNGTDALEIGPTFPAVTDVEGGTCRIRINARTNTEPALAPLMSAKFMVDNHDGLNAVPVDFVVFACRAQ